MEIVWFLLFLVVSHFAGLQIFRFSTYHKYFLPTLPILIGFGILVGWLLFKFGLSAFFLWWLPAEAIWLFVVSRRNSRQARFLLEAAGDDGDQVREMALSVGKTTRYYAYSAFVYVATTSVAFIWVYNT